MVYIILYDIVSDMAYCCVHNVCARCCNQLNFSSVNNYMTSLKFEFRCAQPDQMTRGMHRIQFLSTVNSALHKKVTWCKLSATNTQTVSLLNKHNCVLSNVGLSNALTKTGICTSLKSDFYCRFHSPLHTKSALLNSICTWDLVLTCWKMWWPEPENCRNRRGRSDQISEPHAKFRENR